MRTHWQKSSEDERKRIEEDLLTGTKLFEETKKQSKVLIDFPGLAQPEAPGTSSGSCPPDVDDIVESVDARNRAELYAAIQDAPRDIVVSFDTL